MKLSAGEFKAITDALMQMPDILCRRAASADMQVRKLVEIKCTG